MHRRDSDVPAPAGRTYAPTHLELSRPWACSRVRVLALAGGPAASARGSSRPVLAWLWLALGRGRICHWPWESAYSRPTPAPLSAAVSKHMHGHHHHHKPGNRPWGPGGMPAIAAGDLAITLA
jgi:hypothetical protein